MTSTAGGHNEAMLKLNGIRYLEIYLNDHRALAVGGLELARRIQNNNRGTKWESDVDAFVEEWESDVATIQDVRFAFSVDGGFLKEVAALLGERFGRLKLNGHLVTQSPLSPVVEIESMLALIKSKERLWSTLRTTVGHRPELIGIDLPLLQKRAGKQSTLLEEMHAEAVARAFGGDAPRPGSDVS